MTGLLASFRHSGRPPAGTLPGQASANPESSDFRGLVPAVLLAATVLATQPVAAAEPFGRLFTTPQQRQKLEDLRRAETENPEIVIGPVSVETNEPAQAEAPLNPITVRGLVTRKGGRSMAFLNESNTYEGDLASEYIRVRSGDIEGEKIRLYTPYGDEAVPLRVGETLEPSTGRVIDLTDEEARQNAATPANPEVDTPPAAPAAPGE